MSVTATDAPHDAPRINDGAPAPLPAGLAELIQPLSAMELRLMFDRVADIHKTLAELQEVKDNFPELIKQLPPPFSMMFRNLVP